MNGENGMRSDSTVAVQVFCKHLTGVQLPLGACNTILVSRKVIANML